MANKYLKQSLEAQERMHRRKSCESKAAFDTKAQAYQKGQTSYQCRFCGKWHRATLASRVLLKHRSNKHPKRS